MYAYSYHIVQNSPWPFLISFNLLSFLLRFILNLLPSSPPFGVESNYIAFKSFFSLFSSSFGPLPPFFGLDSIFFRFFLLLFTAFFWFSNISQEHKTGSHTFEVSRGLYIGLLLFILSEVSLFFSFFFALFYNSLAPDSSIGSIWPPFSILPLDFQSIPLFNTFILLSSGFSLTAAHSFSLSSPSLKSHTLKFKSLLFFLPSSKLKFCLILTLLLGLLFSSLQLFEYFSSPFTFSDSVYGSSFFILTGTHGLHIIVGSIFLFYSLFNLSFLLFPSGFEPSGSRDPNTFFSFASIYWHFVDAVWLFLFFFLYCI